MNSLSLRLLLICSVLLTLSPVAHAGTFNVPTAACPTIQSGVDAAHDGDVVLVADGTYTGPGNRDIDFHGKSLTVTSQNGPTKTIIDCGGYDSANGSGYRGFYIYINEKNAAISGFTIKNGSQGVYNNGSGTITVTNCTIIANTSGGIENDNFGGGTIAITGCTVSSNSGFGVDNFNGNGGKITISNCTITANTSGGIINFNFTHDGSSSIALTNCAVSGNSRGGIINRNSTLSGSSSGGGTIMITNCTVSNNSADYGGGISNYSNNNFISSTIAITNCTIFGNSATYDGGGIYNDIYKFDGTVVLTNSVVYRNGNVPIYNSTPAYNSPAMASYCDVQSGYPGTDNIDADPQVFNAATSDLHLKPGSPCLGAGTPNGAPPTDLDGNLRPNPPSMGAYELAFPTLHLTAANIHGDADGIVCDNLNGMNVSLKDTLTATLNDPNAVITAISLANPDGTTTDRHQHPNVGTYIGLPNKLVYYPPDEFNFEQQPQSAEKDEAGQDWITKAATRKVTLTVHYTSGGNSYTATKDIILARPPVVLVHGINSDPSTWNPFIGRVTADTSTGNLGISFPFTTVNHGDPRTFGDPLDNGNAPVEIGAQLLSERIAMTLASVRSGAIISDADENVAAKNEVHQFAGYVGAHFAAKRVDIVAWSYGGAITRWYLSSKPTETASWYQRPFSYVRNKDGITTVYDNTFLPEVSYGGDVRKVITLGTMWRGVPMANWVNEATFWTEPFG